MGPTPQFTCITKGLGDSLADTEDKRVAGTVEMTDLDDWHVVEADHPLSELSLLIPDPSNPCRSNRWAPVKHLNPQKFEDIFVLHQLQCGDASVSLATLRRCWNDRWSTHLKIRDVGQGKRCKICAELSEARQCAGPDTLDGILEQYRFHIDSVMADRNHSVRSNHISEEDAQSTAPDGAELVGKLVVDGMDQAKFRCPRNLASNAEFEGLWKPQLHVTGCIYHGVLEAFYIMSPDVAKDSNMESTVIHRTLDHVVEHQRNHGHPMPANLIVNADNTTREAKNQHFATSMAQLVATDKFQSLEVEFPKTGHTHNELDQRFSTLATTLKRAPVLETPEEFQEYLQENLQEVRGRKIIVEILPSTMNWMKWHAPLDVNISGLAAHHGDLHTNHSWRFVQSGSDYSSGCPGSM